MERELIEAVNDEQELQGAGEQFQMSSAMTSSESSESSEGHGVKLRLAVIQGSQV